MVVDDRRRPAAVAGADLCHVLKDREELHALARSGRGDLVEVRYRRDVRRLVEEQKEGWVERPSGACHRLIDDGEELLDDGREDRPQALLLMKRRTEVER